MVDYPMTDADVIAVLESYPTEAQQQLLWLRDVIYDVAAETEGVGSLAETLKWGQISYLTPETKSGTTIRIDALDDTPEQLAIYVHCQTTLVDTYRSRYGDLFSFEGNRCLKFSTDDALPLSALRDCIALALTYHRSKNN